MNIELLDQGIYLIVRSDGLGLSDDVNFACKEVVGNGISRSVELMPVAPKFFEGAEYLKRNPQIDSDVHISLTSEWKELKWKPLTNAYSLVDENGYFRESFERNKKFPEGKTFFEADWKPNEVKKELEAQIEKVFKFLPNVSHISSHMGLHRYESVIKSIYDDLIKKYGLLDGDLAKEGFKRLRPFGSDTWIISAEEKEKRLINSLESLKPGKWLFVDHPGLDTSEMRKIYHNGYETVAQDRAGVTKAFTSKKVKSLIKSREIKLISYRDVKRNIFVKVS